MLLACRDRPKRNMFLNAMEQLVVLGCCQRTGLIWWLYVTKSRHKYHEVIKWHIVYIWHVYSWQNRRCNLGGDYYGALCCSLVGFYYIFLVLLLVQKMQGRCIHPLAECLCKKFKVTYLIQLISRYVIHMYMYVLMAVR